MFFLGCDFNKFSILECAFEDGHAIEEEAFAVGFIDHPVSLVKGVIVPIHLSESMSHVGQIMSLIDIAIAPCVYAVALLSILNKLAFVLLTSIFFVP